MPSAPYYADMPRAREPGELKPLFATNHALTGEDQRSVITCVWQIRETWTQALTALPTQILSILLVRHLQLSW